MRLVKRYGFNHFVFADTDLREQTLIWKKEGNRLVKEGGKPAQPPAFPDLAQLLLDEGIQEFDIITVPPPSFHDYSYNGGWYPAEILALNLCSEMGIEIQYLWTERYTKKTKKMMQANIDKKYDPPAVSVKNKFVLLLDDIITTGLTLSACCHEIVLAGGYPMGVSFV